MAQDSIHTQYSAGRWINTVEGGPILGSYTSQAAAKAAGRVEAERQRTTHVVHRIDGSVAESHRFGSRSGPAAGSEPRAGNGRPNAPPGASGGGAR